MQWREWVNFINNLLLLLEVHYPLLMLITMNTLKRDYERPIPDITRCYNLTNLSKTNIEDDKSLGAGGFRFSYSFACNELVGKDLGWLPDRFSLIEISGELINYRGPFKREVQCRVMYMVFPTDEKSYDGFAYKCFYQRKFWGDKFSKFDSVDLCYRLLEMLDDFRLSGKERENIRRDDEQIDMYRIIDANRSQVQDFDHVFC